MTGVQTCALPISSHNGQVRNATRSAAPFADALFADALFADALFAVAPLIVASLFVIAYFFFRGLAAVRFSSIVISRLKSDASSNSLYTLANRRYATSSSLRSRVSTA